MNPHRGPAATRPLGFRTRTRLGDPKARFSGRTGADRRPGFVSSPPRGSAGCCRIARRPSPLERLAGQARFLRPHPGRLRVPGAVFHGPHVHVRCRARMPLRVWLTGDPSAFPLVALRILVHRRRGAIATRLLCHRPSFAVRFPNGPWRYKPGQIPAPFRPASREPRRLAGAPHGRSRRVRRADRNRSSRRRTGGHSGEPKSIYRN